MADRVLLVVGELGHRAAVALAVGEERRVVAEPAGAPRLGRQACRGSRRRTDLLLAACRDRRRPARRRSAAGCRPAPRASAWPGSPRRSACSPAYRAERTPGAPAERLGLDPGVVGDRRPPGGGCAPSAPWAARCRRTCRPSSGGSSTSSGSGSTPIPAGAEQPLELAQLVRVAGREHQRRGSGGASDISSAWWGWRPPAS